jgi:formylglycine-generating enzyme
MKKLFFLGLIGLLIVSCKSKTGHLTGVLKRPIYQPEIPLGMVYVNSGSYTMEKMIKMYRFYIKQELKLSQFRLFTWIKQRLLTMNIANL